MPTLTTKAIIMAKANTIGTRFLSNQKYTGELIAAINRANNNGVMIDSAAFIPAIIITNDASKTTSCTGLETLLTIIRPNIRASETCVLKYAISSQYQPVVTKDTVFAKPQTTIAGFAFNETVTQVFADMISRSVPGYELTLEMIGVISAAYSQANTNLYDVGCSLGAASFAMQQRAQNGCNIIGIDNSEAMVKRARELVASSNINNIHIELGDARSTEYNNASLITSNFTLQFIPKQDRFALLQKFANSLVTGGALVLSEKIDFAEPQQSDTMIKLYHDFKQSRGYSELEVAQKRAALENVLIPETLAVHTQRLKEAGFSQVLPWFQCFNFCSIIAIK